MLNQLEKERKKKWEKRKREDEKKLKQLKHFLKSKQLYFLVRLVKTA